MSLRTTRIITLTSLLLSLAACVSAPVRYHSLFDHADIQRQGSRSKFSNDSDTLLIEVAPVRVPDALNSANMLIPASDGSLRVSEQDQWTSPLPDEIRMALSTELQDRLPAIDAYELSLAPGMRRFRISTAISRAELSNGQHFYGIVQWSVRRYPDNQVMAGRTTLDIDIADGEYAQVSAYRKLVRSVAADLAVAIRSLERAPTAPDNNPRWGWSGPVAPLAQRDDSGR